MLKREIREKWARENPCVEAWLNRIGESARRRYLDYAYRYFHWLREHGGEYADKTPEELLDLQEEAFGRERFKQLELLQTWVRNQPGALNSKSNMYSVIHSFYAHNHVPLPKDPTFHIKSDREPVKSKLDLEGLKKIILASNRRYKSIFLTMFQSFMGEGEFEWFNMNSWKEVKPQLEKGAKRFWIWLPGRKHARNRRPYYTFIGHDAVEAFRDYLENERGIIKNGEPIYLNDQLNPVRGANIRRYFNEKAIKVGIIKRATPPCPKCGGETIRFRRRPGRRGHQQNPKVYYRCTQCGTVTPAGPNMQGDRTVRYGVNPHEMRDLARSEWDLSQAKGVSAEFFMGHDIDPNMYNKIMKLHPEWAEQQYAHAEPYLNIISEDPRKVSVNRVWELEQKLEALKTEREDTRVSLARQIEDLRKQLEQLVKERT